MKTIEFPDELLNLLKESRLADRSESDQVRAALAIHLFQERLVSVGKAASLADIPLIEFESLLVQMGLPVVRYDVQDYEADKQGIAAAEQPKTP